MKDYSKKIDELTFLKHYLLLENEIEAKYAPDEISHYPKTGHNIECLNRELTKQLESIKKSYLPIVKRFKERYTFLSIMWASFLVSNLAMYIRENEGKDLWVPLFMFGCPAVLNAIQILPLQKEYTEIKDMDFVDKNFSEPSIDLSTLALSDKAMESLEMYGSLSLNNIDCFTHKDIQKIKKATNNKRIEK